MADRRPAAYVQAMGHDFWATDLICRSCRPAKNHRGIPDQIDPDSVTIRQFVAIMDGDKVVQVLNGMPSLTSSDYEDMVSDTVPQGRHMAKSKPLTDEDRKRIVLEKLRRGDMSLAAHKDPYKREEMNGGDGR